MTDPVYLSKLKLPTGTDGALVEYDLKDAGARQLIEDLGDALYWIGVTTTELEDDVTTSPDITVSGETVTANVGGMAQYDGEEFVYNGTKWQSIGKNNFGDMAFADTASTTYEPAGTVSSNSDAGTSSIAPFGSAGTLPAWSVTGETATFSAGTLPAAGTSVDVLTSVGTFSFAGSSDTITVSPDTV